MKLSPLFLWCILFSMIALNTQAWPAAVDWSNDTVTPITRTIDEEEGKTIPSCTSTDNHETDQGYAGYPDLCHRWNLIWGMDGNLSNESKGDEVTVTLNRIIDWNPAVAAGYRLPTIKELVRLFTYDGSAGIQDAVLRKWLTLGCNDQGEVVDGDGILCNNVAITLRDSGDVAALTVNKEAYLISSTYRDIDGVKEDVIDSGPSSGRWNGRLQIMGVRISDGKVVTFEPGPKGGPFNYYANKSGMLALCEGFLKDGSDIRGSCDYVSSVDWDTNNEKSTLAADRSVVPIFSLLVREVPVVE